MSVNVTDTNNTTPLHISAEFGHLEGMKSLVERGADINTRDNNNNTALHLAAVACNVDIIKGISVNLTDTYDSTPLHISAEFGHLEAKQILVEQDAVINNTNKYGVTPLMLGAYNGKIRNLSLPHRNWH